ncbi:MAG: hypothetical protein J7L98_06075 [Candidatus Verstraetearchaeota archaeon]|nr:hypothetical protein [Candidatus Verstraetearchaeota archaeon]
MAEKSFMHIGMLHLTWLRGGYIAMSWRRRRSPFDIFDDVFGELDEMFERLKEGAIGESSSGYSITITYDDSGIPVVHVETYGEVDEDALRREIEERYPGARIEGLRDKKMIRFVDEGEATSEKRPSIREVDEDRDRRGEGKWYRIKVE